MAQNAVCGIAISGSPVTWDTRLTERRCENQRRPGRLRYLITVSNPRAVPPGSRGSRAYRLVGGALHREVAWGGTSRGQTGLHERRGFKTRQAQRRAGDFSSVPPRLSATTGKGSASWFQRGPFPPRSDPAPPLAGVGPSLDDDPPPPG
ncbi:hypothetical protein SKAU_G00380760 [Synaphobranchus kaupii]|uniref:Uncharacterized protein n=1 Tax=Synaphobranchus kaupii TaxID=118154 RepID=A0A9Q1IEN9_SYNKA|nr:hypothetical protein SKAU_G00380760 [Synaphobranchus kaupii]